MEREGATFEQVRDLVAGARGKMVYATGDADEGIWSAGQVQGLIHDIPTCAELVSRIMRDAEAIIQSRFEGMMSGARRQAAEQAALEHDPEKWVPVFRKRSCSNKKIERDDFSSKRHPALGHPQKRMIA